MQQALAGAESLDVPFAFSTNGDAVLEHDRTCREGVVEREVPMAAFPSPAELWHRYCIAKGLKPSEQDIITQDYHAGASGKAPRYYQQIAINCTMEAIAKGQDRILLVMATGTGKTYTAFQIIWRLWRGRAKKRILFLADRNILVDQTRINDFKPFESAMTKITNRQVDKSYEIYLALYQAVTGTEEERNIYKQFTPDFFDLIIVDECHRGSAADDSAWREVLEYFKSATQIGMTATPKETRDVSNIDYFGESLYTYSLRQGIEDGFLAPYKVVRIDIDKDLQGWRPPAGKHDKNGRLVEAEPGQGEMNPGSQPEPEPPPGGKRVKYVIGDVPVMIVAERVQYYGSNGKLITESIRDYTRNSVLQQFRSLDVFLSAWSQADQKSAILAEMEKRGVLLDALSEEVGRGLDPFDLVCHVAWGQPPKTRKERADSVRKRDYFGKYSETAQEVLGALLDKYADQGIVPIEDFTILNVQPISEIGTPLEIINAFGGRDQYFQALRELEQQIYAA
jgi:type I site-specific restriction endonuclease